LIDGEQVEPALENPVVTMSLKLVESIGSQCADSPSGSDAYNTASLKRPDTRRQSYLSRDQTKCLQ